MRFENWPLLLDAAIMEAQLEEFKWGEFDCLLFVADCIEAMTGIDPAKELRGMYSTEDEANDLISIHYDIDGMLEFMGFPRLPNKNFAQRGDIVTFEFEVDGEAKLSGGICLGEYAMFTVPGGMQQIKIKHCKDGYRVI